MILAVEVTEADVKAGRRGSPNHCPYANALRRMCPSAFSVSVRPHDDMQSGVWWAASVQSTTGRISFNLTPEQSQRAMHFDKTGEMEPHTFEVEI